LARRALSDIKRRTSCPHELMQTIADTLRINNPKWIEDSS
jgi:hypothetical protein